MKTMKMTTQITKIISEPVSKKQHGSTNGLELDAIGIYTLPSNRKETDIFLFILHDLDSHDTNFVIIPSSELRSRLDFQNILVGDTMQIKLWLTTDGRVFEMRHRSGEYEFMGMYTDANRNLTPYLNNWSLIKASIRTK